MANTLYNVVTSMRAAIGDLSEKVRVLETNAAQTSVPPTNVQSPEVSTTFDESAFMDKVNEILNSQTTSFESDIQALKKTLNDIKEEIKIEAQKERSLLETTLTYKFEQHANRLIKERMEDVQTKILESLGPVQQKIDESKNDVLPILQENTDKVAHIDPTLMTTTPNIPPMPSIDDFDFELKQASSSNSVVVSQKRKIIKKKGKQDD